MELLLVIGVASLGWSRLDISRFCRLVIEHGLDGWLSRSREKYQGLPIQPGHSRDGPQAFAGREIKRDNLVLGDAVEVPIGAKA